jgi:hypothetical protein
MDQELMATAGLFPGAACQIPTKLATDKAAHLQSVGCFRVIAASVSLPLVDGVPDWASLPW